MSRPDGAGRAAAPGEHDCCAQCTQDGVEALTTDAHCGNCEGNGCMDCRLRYWHEQCTHSCPMCQPHPTRGLPRPEDVVADSGPYQDC